MQSLKRDGLEADLKDVQNLNSEVDVVRNFQSKFFSYFSYRLNSGTAHNENVPEDDDSGNHSKSLYSPGSQRRSRPAITHMVKRREGADLPLPDASAHTWHKYHYVDDERKKKGDIVYSSCLCGH